jgi:bifunctional non-homologous end joining protein LigD
LKCFIKTTGGKGLHVVIPTKPNHDWQTVKSFAHGFVDFMVKENPLDFVSNMAKAERGGKIFLDYLRNQRGATAIAPYSTRARKNAPIATPLAWEELTADKRDTEYTLKTIGNRLKSLKTDPWKDFFKLKQQLHLDTIK